VFYCVAGVHLQLTPHSHESPQGQPTFPQDLHGVLVAETGTQLHDVPQLHESPQGQPTLPQDLHGVVAEETGTHLHDIPQSHESPQGQPTFPQDLHGVANFASVFGQEHEGPHVQFSPQAQLRVHPLFFLKEAMNPYAARTPLRAVLTQNSGVGDAGILLQKLANLTVCNAP